jgi:hypothetical protein
MRIKALNANNVAQCESMSLSLVSKLVHCKTKDEQQRQAQNKTTGKD